MVNRPQTLRDWNEKLAALYFPELMAPTLVSADRTRLKSFVEEVEHAVVKPLNGAGGFGVLRVGRGDMNLGSAIDLLTNEGKVMIEAQAFIPSVSEGDKRIILLDGEPIGAVNRKPRAGDLRANLHVGGAAEKAVLTDRDREICTTIGPELRRRGLVFVGIDVIGGHLTEINVTSPTGLQEINRLDGTTLEAQIIDAVEQKRLS
jgi:glutathione synthase